MLPLKAGTTRLKNISTPIPPTSKTGEGGAIDDKTLLIMFECVKIVGLVELKDLCNYKLTANITPDGIEMACSQSGLNKTQIEWFLQLSLKKVEKVQIVLQAILDKELVILNVFRKGEDRNKKIELISMSDSWFSPRHVIAREGSFYIKGGLLGDEKLLFSYKDVFEQFKQNLNNLDLSKLEDLTNLNFRWANLKKTNLNGSNLAGTNLEGAEQEEMQVNGADLTGVTGFKLLPTTDIDKSTKLDDCGEIIFDQEHLTGQNLISIISILRKINNETETSAIRYPNFSTRVPVVLSMINTLKVTGLTSDDKSVLLDFLTEESFQTNGSLFSYSKVDKIKNLVNDILMPGRIADANTSELHSKIFEKKYLAEYVKSLKDVDVKAFIDNNRGFIIQLLCIQPLNESATTHEKAAISKTTRILNEFYKSHKRHFFDICFQEKVCPGISTSISTSIGISAENGSTFEFERLPPDILNKICDEIVDEDNLPLSDKINFSLTNKFNYSLHEVLWKQRREEVSGRKDIYSAVGKVVGPSAIQRIKNGHSTIREETQKRLELEKERGGKNLNWIPVIEKYRLDGSLSDEDIRTMTEQGKRNLRNLDIVELINYCKLPIKQGLELTNEEVAQLTFRCKHSDAAQIKELLMSDYLTVKECLALDEKQLEVLSYPLVSWEILKEIRTVTETLELLKRYPCLADRSWVVEYLQNIRLGIKSALFLSGLRDKYRSGDWLALSQVIKPKGDVENESVKMHGRI